MIRRYWPHHADKIVVLGVGDLFLPEEVELQEALESAAHAAGTVRRRSGGSQQVRRELRTLYRDNKPSGLLTLAVYRFGNTVYYRFKTPVLGEFLLVLYAVLDHVIVKMLCGAEFPARCRIGKHLRLPHGANGARQCCHR